jgi:hypothetical protein
MNVGHTILFYVAITAAIFIALDGWIESDHFSILRHNVPVEDDDPDWVAGKAKKTSLETYYTMVCESFAFKVP